MSNLEDESKIIIKLDIQIPLRMGAVGVRSDHPVLMMPMTPVVACLASIDIPAGGATVTVNNPVEGLGTVFVRGSVTGVGAGITVVGKVFPPDTIPPENPAAGFPSTTTDDQGVFTFEALGDAACNNDPYGNYPLNKAKVWVYCNPCQPPTSVVVSFFGMCFNFAPMVRVGRSAFEMEVEVENENEFETAPLQWVLRVAGFTGDLACFNGSWRLDARNPRDGRRAWDNGGDADASPLVELSCDGQGTRRLLFRLGGFSVTYARAAGSWNALGSNILAGPTAAGGCTGTAPPSLVIEPR